MDLSSEWNEKKCPLVSLGPSWTTGGMVFPAYCLKGMRVVVAPGAPLLKVSGFAMAGLVLL